MRTFVRGALAVCWLTVIVLLAPILAEERPYPKIALPWEYLGEQPDKSFRLINRIGDAIAALDYHPSEDLWLLSLSNKTGKQHFANLEAISVFSHEKGQTYLESALDCSDCIEVQNEKSTIHVPLSEQEVAVIQGGFYLDFHYMKAGIVEEENGFVFRVGLIEAGKQIRRIKEETPEPKLLSQDEFNKGRIWLLRNTTQFRHTRVFATDLAEKKTRVSMKQKENENWYSDLTYGERLPVWLYEKLEDENGSESLVLVIL